jgi:DNA processing protein
MLGLFRVPGLGPRSIRALVDARGSAEAVVGSLARSVETTIAGIPRRGRGWRRETLAGLAEVDVTGARAAIERYAARGIDIRVYGSAGYPDGLSDLDDPPPLLFLEGPGVLDQGRSVAIVGTRAASDVGLGRARELASELARWGWTVVSGMARGIDAAAHEGALDAGGCTIGVLGSGFDRPYPVENRGLFRRMRRHGLLVSEFEPHTPPRRASFPRRNRIIAALGRAVVVAEAGLPSGALITADHALDLGRDVLAVPYRVDDPGGPGCLRLLRQGAGVAAGARDVFDAVGWLHDRPGPDALPAPGSGPAASSAAGPATSSAAEPAKVVGLLRRGDLSADEIAERLARPPAEVLAELARLELEGIVGRAPTGRFRVRASVE